MIPYEFQTLTLMQIDLFFHCAEQKNFTKVAQELHVTPGMVSKKIAAMETALGFPLFRREKKRVDLTPQGEALYAAWRQPVKTMVHQAESIRYREQGNTAVAFSLWEATNLERFFVPLISAFSAEENLMFRIRMNDGFEGLNEVASGKTDIAFIPKFAERGVAQMEELECFLALPSPLYVALSSGNPLAQKRKLQVEDLEKIPLLISNNMVSWYTDMLTEICMEKGFSPKFKRVQNETFKTLYLHMEDHGVLITDKYFHAFRSNALEYRELENTESGLLMVYRKDAPPHVKQFVERARTFYRELR